MTPREMVERLTRQWDLLEVLLKEFDVYHHSTKFVMEEIDYQLADLESALTVGEPASLCISHDGDDIPTMTKERQELQKELDATIECWAVSQTMLAEAMMELDDTHEELDHFVTKCTELKITLEGYQREVVLLAKHIEGNG